MKPGTWDITIYRGEVWEFTFTWRDSAGAARNLTGYTATGVHIKRVGSGIEQVFPVTLGGAAGTIAAKIEETDTALIDWSDGTWFLELSEPDGDPFRLLKGLVRVRD